jgi:hypothetical protein
LGVVLHPLRPSRAVRASVYTKPLVAAVTRRLILPAVVLFLLFIFIDIEYLLKGAFGFFIPAVVP